MYTIQYIVAMSTYVPNRFIKIERVSDRKSRIYAISCYSDYIANCSAVLQQVAAVVDWAGRNRSRVYYCLYFQPIAWRAE